MQRPGKLLGEMALLDPDGLRTATVRALTDLRLAVMGQADFDALYLVVHLWPWIWCASWPCGCPTPTTLQFVIRSHELSQTRRFEFKNWLLELEAPRLVTVSLSIVEQRGKRY